MSQRQNWDYGRDYEGGVRTRAVAPDFGGGTVTRLDSTAFWDESGSNVGTANGRYDCNAGSPFYTRTNSGFAYINFDGNDAEIKTYGDYKRGGSFQLYHRNTIYGKPDGQMQWLSVQYTQNGGNDLNHKAETLYKDPR